jgi:hypothetical protein
MWSLLKKNARVSTPVPAMADTTACPPELADAESLAQKLKQLVTRLDNTPDGKIIRRESEILERWITAYRRSVAITGKISPSEISLLAHLHAPLKQLVDANRRLEEEGGRPPTHEEAVAIHSLMKTIRRIERMLNLAHALHTMTPEREDA